MVEVLIATAVAATAGSMIYANEAADAQRDAARIQQKQAKLQAQRQRSEQIRAARIARARTVLAGEAQGVSGSSGVQGGTGSIISQLGSNLGFSLQMESMSDQASAELAQASKESGMASVFGGIADMAMTAAQAGGFGSGGGSSGGTSGSGGGSSGGKSG